MSLVRDGVRVDAAGPDDRVAWRELRPEGHRLGPDRDEIVMVRAAGPS